MSAPRVFGRDDPASYQAAVDAAGVVEVGPGDREALSRELFGAAYDPDRMKQPDEIRHGRPEPDVPGGA